MSASLPNDDADRLRLRKEGGAWLKQVREEAGLSQRQLAEAVHVGYYTFVSQIEAGRGRIPADRYAVWAEAVGVPARDFVRSLMFYYEPTTYEILFGGQKVA